MKKNLKTSFNIINQRILVFLSFISLIYAIYFSINTKSYILLILSFLIGKFITGLLSTQIILHRYFSHRSFKTSNLNHKIFCFLSILAGQGSPVSWAAHHRHHHMYADTDLDTHSPTESKILSAGFWILKSYDFYLNVKKLRRVPTDLLRDKTIKFVDDYYYFIWFFIILIFFLINLKILIFFILSPLAWGFINSACITLLSHIKLPGSYRSFNTNDNSYNNKYIQIYMLGEALHNNHHMYPDKYNEKFNQKEFDLAGLIIEKFLIKK